MSSQEGGVAVRPVDADVAECAALVFRVQHVVRARLYVDAEVLASGTGAVVAFKAKREDDGPAQKFRVHRAVRNVTSGTAFDADARMFKDERPALIDVAFQAGLFVIEGGLQHGGVRHCAG